MRGATAPPLLLALALALASVAAAQEPVAILIVEAGEPDQPEREAFQDGFQGALANASQAPSPPVVYTFNLELSRPGSAASASALDARVRERYQGIQMAVIVALTNPAVSAALRWRDALWPGVPVVCLQSADSDAPPLTAPQATAVLVDVDPSGHAPDGSRAGSRHLESRDRGRRRGAWPRDVDLAGDGANARPAARPDRARRSSDAGAEATGGGAAARDDHPQRRNHAGRPWPPLGFRRRPRLRLALRRRADLHARRKPPRPWRRRRSRAGLRGPGARSGRSRAAVAGRRVGALDAAGPHPLAAGSLRPPRTRALGDRGRGAAEGQPDHLPAAVVLGGAQGQGGRGRRRAPAAEPRDHLAALREATAARGRGAAAPPLGAA